jgi:hypothetical protein
VRNERLGQDVGPAGAGQEGRDDVSGEDQDEPKQILGQDPVVGEDGQVAHERGQWHHPVREAHMADQLQGGRHGQQVGAHGDDVGNHHEEHGRRGHPAAIGAADDACEVAFGHVGDLGGHLLNRDQQRGREKEQPVL